MVGWHRDVHARGRGVVAPRWQRIFRCNVVGAPQTGMLRELMRFAFLMVLFLAISNPSFGQPETSNQMPPTANDQAQFERDEARWADLEAQRRATDGDYDGAVQAHQQAEQALQEVNRGQPTERSVPPRQ